MLLHSVWKVGEIPGELGQLYGAARRRIVFLASWGCWSHGDDWHRTPDGQFLRGSETYNYLSHNYERARNCRGEIGSFKLGGTRACIKVLPFSPTGETETQYGQRISADRRLGTRSILVCHAYSARGRGPRCVYRGLGLPFGLAVRQGQRPGEQPTP